MKNNIRFDLSDYLIHFYRDVNLDSGSHILLPEHCGFNCNHHNTLIDARYLLRLALRNNKLSASWSYRNNIRTIYGCSPAICYTDMPISAYLESGFNRMNNRENIGLYALVFPKDKMFQVGARPVIYALDSDNSICFDSDVGDERIINTDVLPLIEQYRYVTYVPNRIDWTHEREWRWPYRGDTEYLDKMIKELGIIDDISNIPGLDFSKVDVGGAGVIVPYANDVPIISHDILTLIDRGVIHKDFFKFIIAIENISSFSQILEPLELSNHINSCAFDFDGYFNFSSDEVNLYVKPLLDYVDELYKDKDFLSSSYPYEYGNSWIWVQDNQSAFVRVLLQSGIISVNKEGRYLIDIKLNEKDWSLRKKEDFANHVAEWINNRFGLLATSFSVAGSHDFDELPYYVDSLDEEHPFYNETISVDW